MWKKAEKPWGAKKSGSTGDVERNGWFSTDLPGGQFSTEKFFFFTGNVEKSGHRLELILVLISLTISAKEASFFIFFSIC